MNERTLKRWLLASLVLNLFLVGGIAGGAWRWWTTTAPAQPRGLRFAADELSPEQRQNYRMSLREARREASTPIQTAREGRQEALRLLGAPQFDRDAVSAALARTREADMAARTRLETSVVDFAATLSPEDRQKLVNGLARRSSLGGPSPTPSK